MREWPDCSNTTINSPSFVLISSASTSARGIITSSTRTSRNLSMLWSMARSPGEKDSASVSVSASAPAISSRRLEPLRGLNRLVSRSRKDGLSEEPSSAAAGAVLGLGPSSVVSEAALAPPASGFAAGSGMSVIVVRSVSISVTRRDREWQASQERRALSPPSLPPPARPHDRGPEDAAHRGSQGG